MLGCRGTQVASEIMTPPYNQLKLITFGGTLGPPPGNWVPANPFTTETVIDANDNVTNKMVGNLNHARWFPSSVLLPDGKILAVGGGDKDEVIDPGTEVPVKTAELYDPGTGKWSDVASHSRDRTYHNSAILLPDMRVLLGGHAPIASHFGGANADQGVRLIQWMVLRHAVDGGGRDVYHTRRAEPLAHSQHVPRTLHIDLANIFGFPQGQASRRMHYHVGAGQFAFERRHIAHVAARPGDAFRIIFGMELGNVEQVNVCPLSQLIGQMVTQESRSPGNDETHQILIS